jgi:hypothetical protein
MRGGTRAVDRALIRRCNNRAPKGHESIAQGWSPGFTPGLPWVYSFIAARPVRAPESENPGKRGTALWRCCLLAPLSGRTLGGLFPRVNPGLLCSVAPLGRGFRVVRRR